MKEESLFVCPRERMTPRCFDGTDPFYCPEPSKWNRKLYYESPNPELYEGDYSNIPLDMKNLKESLNKGNFEGVPGVWSIWGSQHENEPPLVLDVHQTLDLGYEIRMFDLDMRSVMHLSWSDLIFHENGPLFSLAKRNKAISSWKCLQYVVENAGMRGRLYREALEAQWAWDHKAIYWNRSYYQAVTKKMLDQQKTNSYIMSLK